VNRNYGNEHATSTNCDSTGIKRIKMVKHMEKIIGKHEESDGEGENEEQNNADGEEEEEEEEE